jgi:alpha-L-fucosidase 2
MLDKFPPYQKNEDGAVKEWMHSFYKDNDEHRHLSHIYPVFPGTEVSQQNQPGMFDAFLKAVNKRLSVGLKEQTGWSLAHMSNIYARMGEGDKALDCLGILSRSCLLNNFYTVHNDWRDMGIGFDLDWAPFQIDANMGWTAAIQEMLLNSRSGFLSVLPALPTRLPKGSAGLLLARGAIEVRLSWDMEEGIINAEYTSLHNDQEVELALPQGFRQPDKDGPPTKLFLPKGLTVVAEYRR